MIRSHEREDYMNWYAEPATPNQITFMDRLGITYKSDISKGTASDLIDARLQGQHSWNKAVFAIAIIFAAIAGGIWLYVVSSVP